MQENNDHSISDDMIAPADQTSMWDTIRYGGTSQQISPFARDPKEEAHRRMLALHKLWLDSLQHEYPSPYAHYRIGVYIRYFNQTRHENYLLFHKQEFIDTMLVSTWEGEMYSLSGNTLNAVARLIAAYGDALNEETFKERLGLVSMKTIIRTARERRPGSLGYAEAMLVFYNKKCKYRLSMKKLYGLNSDEDDIEEDDDPCDVE